MEEFANLRVFTQWKQLHLVCIAILTLLLDNILLVMFLLLIDIFVVFHVTSLIEIVYCEL